MASGMCIQLRRVIDTALPARLIPRSCPDACCEICLLPVASVSSGASPVALPSLQARCPLDLTAMMAVLRRAMCMKHISVYLLFSIATQSLCCADVTQLSGEDRKALLDSSRFHVVHFTRDLPPTILALCDGGGDGKLAEPGQKWNATDAIIDPALPGKRLIWATVGGDYYVVHYERGGIAHTFHILVAKLRNDNAKPKAVCRAVGGPFKDYAAFLDALRSGKLDDRLDYPH